MRIRPYLSLLVASAAFALAACGGGGSVPHQMSVPTTIAPYQGSPSLASFTWGSNQLSGAQLERTIASGTFGMNVLVKQRNTTALMQYARDVSDPHSPNYRHFLTPQQVADRFAASSADYSAAAKYFAQAGLHVGGWPQRQVLYIDGSVTALKRAFGTDFAVWSKNGREFIAPAQTPHLSTNAPIAAVSEMVRDTQSKHSYMVPGVPTNGIGGYAPQQVERAFDYTGAYAHGLTGHGISVAIIGTGPIDPADAAVFSQHFGAAMAHITQVDATDQGVSTGLSYSSPSPLPSGEPPYSLSSGLQTPPPVTAPCSASYPGFAVDGCNPEDAEAQLDTQQIAALAPGSNVLFYLAYNPNDCFMSTGIPQNDQPCPPGGGMPAEGILETDAEIQQVIADDKADVVSMSFGAGESCYAEGVWFDSTGLGFGPAEIATMVAEGMAVFASSGDSAAYTCGFAAGPAASYPASDLNAVAVGGVTALINDDGTLHSQPTVWGAQTWDGVNPLSGGPDGTGGGLSHFFVTPPWQQSISSLRGYRGLPDVSLVADPATGVAVTINASFGSAKMIEEIGGTSVAAPEMSAMWALVLQACKQDAMCQSKGGGSYPYRLGNPAPLLYQIYANKDAYASVFDDVLYGNNGKPISSGDPGYFSGPGYDLATGLGVPNAGHLINAILSSEGGTNPNLP